jgi:hypothetical protein
MDSGRRGFLHAAAGTALLGAAGGHSKIVLGFDRGELLSEQDRLRLAAFLSDDELWALGHAALAPSGHNTQPWTVQVVERHRWIIGSDRSRWLPAVDPLVRETTLSVGAFLENLIVAAGARGYAVDYKVIGETTFDAQLLDLTLHRDPVAAYPIERLKKRRTVRGGHLSDAIKSADLRFITDGSSGCHYFPRDSGQARYLAEATLEANKRQQLQRDDAQEELANWLRWSRADQARFRNGLTPASMELGVLARWYTGHFYDQASVMTKGFRQIGVKQVAEQVGQGGGWLVIESADSSVASLIETGRKLERLWLKARERAIAIHPMTQALEEAPWSTHVAAESDLRGVPQFILRVGYVRDYPEPVSPRMPVAWFAKAA